MTAASKEYALALFSLSKESNEADRIYEGLKLIRGVFDTTPGLMSFLVSPAIPKEERTKAIEDAFSGSVHEYALSFLSVLCEHGDMHSLFDCLDEYEKLYSENIGKSHVKVTSAVELTGNEKQKLCEKLEKKTGKRVEMTYSVDKSLLGGLRIDVDGTIMDGSLVSRLRSIKEVMDE